MLIPQYSTSRLIDRLVDEGLAARRECKIDKRGQFVEITEAGRELQKKMWNAYSAAIENMSARNCPIRTPPGSADCWTGWAAPAATSRRASHETARPPDDTILPQLFRTGCPRILLTPRAFGCIAPDPEFLWRVTKSI